MPKSTTSVSTLFPRWVQLAPVAALVAVGPAPRCLAQSPQLQYQDRGDRFEGVRGVPVAGAPFELELLSAVIDTGLTPIDLPEKLGVRFYLPETRADVHVTVRELEPRVYYWLDKIQPTRPWTQGFGNVFEWPTRTVMAPLGFRDLSNLGVVARLGSENASAAERVAPVIVHAVDGARVNRVGRYSFAVRATRDSRVMFEVSREGSEGVLLSRALERVVGGQAFVVQWDGANAPEGWYRLAFRAVSQSRVAGGSATMVVQYFHRLTPPGS